MVATLMRSNRQKLSEMADFYLPLALQNMSQSFSYPLVAMVASRGANGPLNIAAIAQASSVAFLIFTLGSGIVTTGMVFLRSQRSLERYLRVNAIFSAVILATHVLACLPPVGHLIFGTIMGLTPQLERPTYFAFVLMLPLSLLFNIRNPYMATLLNEKKTGMAYLATLTRIALTILLSALFVACGAVGILWSVLCLAAPILVEVFLVRFFARPFLLALPEGADEKLPSVKSMIMFTLSFSIGSVLVCLSGYLIGAFAARAPHPEIMLPVYYVVTGLANPVAFGATRIQALVIAFGNDRGGNARLALFTAASGALLGLLPLIFLLPPLDRWYYVVLQKMPAEHFPHIRQTAILLLAFPLAVAFRAYFEGWAAYYKKPVSMLAGQGVYLGTVVTAAFLALNCGAHGNMIGPISLVIGNICAMGAIMLSLNIEGSGQYPASESSTPFPGK